MIWQYLLNGLLAGALYSLLALGFALVYNTTHIFHLAYAAVCILGAYLFVSFSGFFGGVLIPTMLSILWCACISAGMEAAVYYPLFKKQSSLNIQMISSMGVLIVMINSIGIIYGNDSQHIKTSFLFSPFTQSFLMLSWIQVIQFLTGVICLAFLGGMLYKTQFGLHIRALKDNPTLLATLGINIKLLRIKIFLLSGGIGAICGILFLAERGISPYSGMNLLLYAIVAIIIGGIGRFRATIIGGFSLGLVQAISDYFFSARWQEAVIFSILLLFLLFRPQGIMGEKLRMV